MTKITRSNVRSVVCMDCEAGTSPAAHNTSFRGTVRRLFKLSVAIARRFPFLCHIICGDGACVSPVAVVDDISPETSN